MTADDLEHCSTVGAHRAPLQLTALSSYLRDTTLALVEIIDEHVERNFPGVAPPRILRDLKLKFDQSVAQHRREIAIAIKAARTMTLLPWLPFWMSLWIDKPSSAGLFLVQIHSNVARRWGSMDRTVREAPKNLSQKGGLRYEQ